MNTRNTLGLLMAALALWAGLSGCSDTNTREGSTTRTYQAGELRLGLVAELAQVTHKVQATDDGRRASEVDNLLQPAYFDFTLRPERATDLDQHYFAWHSQAGSVNQRLNISATWLGPRGEYGYEMGPHGLNFNLPVTMCIDVTPLVDLDLAEADELLVLLDNENGSYDEVPAVLETIPGDMSHPDRIRLRVTLWHFSKYVIGIGPPPGGEGGN
jgi:hypothetical protein